jgi:MOSC domain-containing protein YiiM
MLKDAHASGRIIAVCTSREKGTTKEDAGSARLIEEYGIEGDAHGGFAHRQISLIASEDIDEMKAKLPGLRPGSFAENLTTRGLDLAPLSVGDRLKAGECLLEVSQIGKECHAKCAVFERSGECIMPQKGVFCRVVEGGVVKNGDGIEIVGKDSAIT